ncbi:MAG TPA: hypothetical protein VGQ36_21655 [Thermoanaerobaculia bacterium]|jgi:hypothetical protein|nr:hypothetical protein [Thermoanaerobaculia bacterium]
MRIALIVSLLSAAVLHAQAPPTFKEGVLAFEKQEWAKAERLMRETIAGNPNESEGTVSIAGAWYETYVPHYFLARALAKQGKCAEALKAFAETERQGVTPNIPDFARHVRTRGGCRPAPPEKKPTRVIGEVEVPFEDVPKPIEPKPIVVEPKPVEPKPVEPKPRVADVETRARLTAAVRAYVEGQYDVTVSVLSEKPFADRAAAAEAALFRAAARDALYRIGGEKDDALRIAVESDLRIYRELRTNRQPDPRIFPPRFIAKASK